MVICWATKTQEEKMDRRQISEEYTAIAEDLIQSEDVLAHLRDCKATIVYLSSEHKMMKDTKAVLGLCEKVNEKYKWGIPADFTITLFEPNLIGLSSEQIRIVIFHELLHVGIGYHDGEEQYSVIPHDIEDFKYIIDRYGAHWSEPTEEEHLSFEGLEMKIDLDSQIEENLKHLE